MQTNLTTRQKGKVIETLFDRNDLINIRNYQAALSQNETFDAQKVYTFKLIVRHADNEDPRIILDTALKTIRKSN